MFRKKRRSIKEGQPPGIAPTNIRRKLKNYLFVIGVIVLMSVALLIPNKIIIKNIECTSQNGKCSQRIESGIWQYVGMPLRTSQNAVRDFLTHELVSKDMTIRYRYPSTLSVTVVETKPVFALSNNDENTFRLLDENGNVLSESNETNLPYAKVQDELPAVGAKVDEGTIFALGILSDLSSSYQLSKGELNGDGLLVELPTKTKVLFPLNGDREILLGSFILVINQLNSVKVGSTMDKVGLAGKTLDLRYKNPVIR